MICSLFAKCSSAAKPMIFIWSKQPMSFIQMVKLVVPLKTFYKLLKMNAHTKPITALLV